MTRNRRLAVAVTCPVLLVAASCALQPNAGKLPGATGAETGAGASSAGATAEKSVTMSRIDGKVSLVGMGDASGIEVTAYPVGQALGGPSYAAITDTSGRFSIPLPGGEYNLVARKPGTPFRAIRWSVQAATTVDFSLTPTGRIQGAVAGAADLTGATVFVPGTDILALADASGSYLIDLVPVGTYSVTVQRPGFTAGKVQVVVAAGATATAPALNLQPAIAAASVTGKVSLLGRGVSDSGSASVEVRTMDGASAKGLTAADGTYTLGGLPAAFARLTFSKAGFATASQEAALFPGDTRTIPTTQVVQPGLGLVVTRVTFESTVASRSLTVRNFGLTPIDLNKAAISYEYDSAGSLLMQHLRFGKDQTLAPGADFTFATETNSCSEGKCVYKDGASTLGGSSATTLGLQAGKGSLVVYSSAANVSDMQNSANVTDYLQYGSAPTGGLWSHSTFAGLATIWDGSDKFSPAGAADKVLAVKTVGAFGSANWQLQ